MIPADHWHDNGDGTAWLIESPNGLPPLTEMFGTDERDLDRPCDTCGGGLEEAFQWRDWQTVSMIQDCPDCDGTGRHTFTVEVQHDTDWSVIYNAPQTTKHFRVSVAPGMVERQEDGTWRVQLQIH